MTKRRACPLWATPAGGCLGDVYTALTSYAVSDLGFFFCFPSFFSPSGLRKRRRKQNSVTNKHGVKCRPAQTVPQGW
jgi:hypothetical protein